MAFSEEEKRKAFDRQKGVCAACEKKLVWGNRQEGDRGAWEAHHIKKDVEESYHNCVCLCINKPNCHLKVGHSGDFANEPAQSLSEDLYPYAFGPKS